MKKNKLDALLWEQNMFDNLIIQGATDISQENLDDILFEYVDEFGVSRDDDYNIKLKCIRHINRFRNSAPIKKPNKKDVLAGSLIPEGKISIKLFDEFQIIMQPCFYNGYESKMDKTEYNLSCYHIEGKDSTKKMVALKEWIINGKPNGLYFCTNKKFEYMVEGTVLGLYGDMYFPQKQMMQEQSYVGRFVHVQYKDTAFDIHYVNDTYGPQWSTNISISYYEDYGRIPNSEERGIIREYISFLAGKRLIYTGESHYDENGNVIGFVMESPRTYGMDIKSLCAQVGCAPIRNDITASQNYFETFIKYIEPFEKFYSTLDFQSLFSAYWYAHEIAKPMDLPILSGALEHLMKKWYSEIKLNPETVLMDKKEFSKCIMPIIEKVEEQFEGTEYVERMKRSILNINRMSVNEQVTNFFTEISLPIGEEEKKALRARNFSAHGSFREGDYREQYLLSRVYECLISRVVLKLLGYKGFYVDYGTIGYPMKEIDCPIGCDVLYKYPESREFIQYYRIFYEVFKFTEKQEKNKAPKDDMTIEIHNKENDCDTPHIHAYYQGNKISISLMDGNVITGNIPKNNQKIAVDWVKDNFDMLRNTWKNKCGFIIFPDMNKEITCG